MQRFAILLLLLLVGCGSAPVATVPTVNPVVEEAKAPEAKIVGMWTMTHRVINQTATPTDGYAVFSATYEFFTDGRMTQVYENAADPAAREQHGSYELRENGQLSYTLRGPNGENVGPMVVDANVEGNRSTLLDATNNGVILVRVR